MNKSDLADTAGTADTLSQDPKKNLINKGLLAITETLKNEKSFQGFEKKVAEKLLEKLASDDIKEGKKWVAEIKSNGNYDPKKSTGRRVDLAYGTDKSTDLKLTEIHELLELKIFRQYSDKSIGHEYPILFFKADPGANNYEDLLVENRVESESMSCFSKVKQKRILDKLNCFQLCPECSKLFATDADEGQILYDFTKMISFTQENAPAAATKASCYLMLFHITKSLDRILWGHTHQTDYVQQKLNDIFRTFFMISRLRNKFEVYDWRTEHGANMPIVSAEYDNFHISVTADQNNQGDHDISVWLLDIQRGVQKIGDDLISM